MSKCYLEHAKLNTEGVKVNPERVIFNIGCVKCNLDDVKMNPGRVKGILENVNFD